MMLLVKIAAVGLLHVVFYACYPETGDLGNYYLAVSLLLWGVFVIFINTSTALIRFISGAAGTAINLAAFALMALAIAATMPQRDKTGVLEKIQDGKYPDRATINSGLRRFGVKIDREAGVTIKDLDRKAAEVLDKVKKD